MEYAIDCEIVMSEIQTMDIGPIHFFITVSELLIAGSKIDSNSSKVPIDIL